MGERIAALEKRVAALEEKANKQYEVTIMCDYKQLAKAIHRLQNQKNGGSV